jgi:hypothetical protein
MKLDPRIQETDSELIIIIPRHSLPLIKLVEHDDGTYVELVNAVQEQDGAGWPLWKLTDATRVLIRDEAIHHVAAWWASEVWHDREKRVERELNERRDKIAREVLGRPYDALLGMDNFGAVQKLIDKLAEAR